MRAYRIAVNLTDYSDITRHVTDVVISMHSLLAQIINRYLPARVVARLRRISWKIRPPEREVPFAKKIMKMLGGSAIDIGANNGLYTLMLANAANRIIAFEANPDLAGSLRSVSPANVQIENCAVSDAPGSLNLKIPRIAGVQNTGMATVSRSNTFDTQSVESIDEISVQAITLDDYVRNKKVHDVTFIKIDVEGFEKEVLDGAMLTIKTEQPILLIETEIRHKADVAGLFKALEDIGYSALMVNESGSKLIPVHREQVRELQSDIRLAAKQQNHFDFSYVNNFFFVPRHKMNAIAGLLK